MIILKPSVRPGAIRRVRPQPPRFVRHVPPPRPRPISVAEAVHEARAHRGDLAQVSRQLSLSMNTLMAKLQQGGAQDLVRQYQRIAAARVAKRTVLKRQFLRSRWWRRVTTTLPALPQDLRPCGQLTHADVVEFWVTGMPVRTIAILADIPEEFIIAVLYWASGSRLRVPAAQARVGKTTVAALTQRFAAQPTMPTLKQAGIGIGRAMRVFFARREMDLFRKVQSLEDGWTMI